MTVRADLLKRWQFYCKEGFKKDEYEKIDKKYDGLKELKAPKLNAQIAATMKEYATVRDKYMVEIQDIAGKALSIIGSVITSLYDEGDMSLELLLMYLSDSAKFLTAIINKESRSRKAFIEPGLSKDTVTILKETKIDEYLYGSQLSEKIKEAKALNKMSENLKIQQPNKPAKPGKQPLNSRFPFARRPIAGQTGSTSTSGRPKQRPFFRNKQQFVNQNAQAQRPQMPQKQDKKS